MKTQLSKDQQQVWKSCVGKNNSITLLQLTNFYDIGKRLGLAPVAMRVGSDMLPFNESDFRRAIREGQRVKNDTYCMTYYDPPACADVSGSAAPNWLTWSRVALGIQSGDPHSDLVALCDLVDGHTAILDHLASLRTLGSRNNTPILSATVVMFYFAAQKSWPDAALYYNVVEKMKMKLEKLNITVLTPAKRPLPPDDASDIDVDDLLAGFPKDDGTDGIDHDSYADAAEKDADTVTTSFVAEDEDVAAAVGARPSVGPGVALQAAYDGDNGKTIDTTPKFVALTPEQLATLSDDEFAAYEFTMMKALATARSKRDAQRVEANWKSGKITDRDQWPGKGYDRTVTMSYDDGTTITFVHRDWNKSPRSPIVEFTIPPDVPGDPEEGLLDSL